MEKRLVIADLRSNAKNGKSTGHYLPVASMYQSLFRDKCEVYVAGGPVYKTKFSDDKLCLLPYNVCGTSWLDKLRILLNARCLFKQTHKQTVVIQHSSLATALLAVAIAYKGDANLFVIAYNNEGCRSRIARVILNFARPKIKGLICPKKDVGIAYGMPYCVLPDYIMTVDKACLPKVSFFEKKYDFCVIGRIVADKGVVESARKFAGLDYKIVIAGMPESVELERILLEICKNSDNVTLMLDYVSEETYSMLLQQSRYCLLNYQGEYSKRSSGVVFDTIFSNVPVVGCKCDALNFVEEHGVGMLYNDIESFDPKLLLKQEIYDSYLSNIELYKNTHKEKFEVLSKFLGID